MKNAIIIILVLLILSVAGNWIQMRSAEVERRHRIEDNERAQIKVKSALAQIDQRDSAISTLLAKQEKDSLLHAKEQGRLKRVISSQKARQEKRDVPILEDSIISNQDELIADLENERDTLYLTSGTLVDSLTANYETAKALFVEQLKRSMKLEDKLYREKKKRFGIGPYVGVDWRGVSVGVSVQYQIFKFKL